MSLIGALNIGKSALATHQAALQVTGSNIANAGNADHTRQVGRVAANADQQIQPGMFVGTGVGLQGVQRQIDEALQARLRGSLSDAESAQTMNQWLGQIEAIFNELGGTSLSTRMSEFFNAWSNLANKPQDLGLRQIVLQTGESLGGMFQSLRGELEQLQQNADARLRGLTREADRLAQQVADLNRQITVAEGGSSGQANALRDQRDQALGELSKLIDIRTVEDGSTINVYVGSEPLVMGSDNRGVGWRPEAIDGRAGGQVIVKASNSVMKAGGGQIGALAGMRSEHIDGRIEQVDALAGSLIFELNTLHASGQGLSGFENVTGTNAVDDPASALMDPQSGLAFAPAAGSFVVHVKDAQSGLVSSTLIEVDDSTSLASLSAALDEVENVSASTSAGRLTLGAGEGFEISFSQDSSGVLASLGVNAFFMGADARDIGVNAVLKDRPELLSAAQNGEPADNQTARAIAALESRAVGALGGLSLKESYQGMINGIAVSAASARQNAESSRVVKETLLAHREALSGVSLDEEAINLMRHQQAFQGAARMVATVDEMMRTVLNLV